MPQRTSDGLNVFIDEVIVEKLNATQPSYMSRTAWVNHLLDLAVSNLPAQYRYAADEQS